MFYGDNIHIIPAWEVENNPDFWEEEIVDKKPLFTTEDGVEVFYDWAYVYVVHPKTYKLRKISWGSFNNDLGEILKVFSTVEAAESWISENKPVYSRKQILEAIESSRSEYWAKSNVERQIKEKLNL